MGNHLSGSGLCSNSGGRDSPCRVQLGRCASINLTEREVSERDDDGAFKESWTISYTVHGLKSNSLKLTKKVGKDGKVNWLRLGVNEFYFARELPFLSFSIEVRRKEADFLSITIEYLESINAIMSKRVNRTINSWGGVTGRQVYLYGNGNMGGLLVIESKKKSEDGKCYALTVAHYYANSSGNIFNKTDIGLSMVARIRVSRGNLDITVEGPLSHPASALFYMFDHVFGTGTWKPTACPHCADNVRKQTRMLLQSTESEDSDGVPFVPPHGTRHVTNRGAFVGDGNGNFFERNNFMFFRK